MLAQVARLQAKAIHGVDDRSQQFREPGPYLLHFVVERLLVEVIVDTFDVEIDWCALGGQRECAYDVELILPNGEGLERVFMLALAANATPASERIASL